MPRLTTKEIQTFRARATHLCKLLDDVLALRTDDKSMTPKEVMLVTSVTVANLASAFDFGDEIRNKIRPGLVLRVMKANTAAHVREAKAEAFAIAEQMRQYLAERIETIEQEHSRVR